MRITASILCGLVYVLVAGAAAAAPRGPSGVSVMTASDASPGLLDARARGVHGAIAQRAATATLNRRGIHARRAAVAAFQLDVTVIRWRVASAGRRDDVTAEIRIVLCDHSGRMISIAKGKATVSGDHAHLASLREQAITAGVDHLVVELEPQIARPAA